MCRQLMVMQNILVGVFMIAGMGVFCVIMFGLSAAIFAIATSTFMRIYKRWKIWYLKERIKHE